MVLYRNRIRASHTPKQSKKTPQTQDVTTAQSDQGGSSLGEAQLSELELQIEAAKVEDERLDEIISQLKDQKNELKDRKRAATEPEERHNLDLQKKALEDELEQHKRARKQNDKNAKKLQKALRAGRRRAKTKGRAEAARPEEITAKYAVRRMRGITNIGTGQEGSVGLPISSEVRWVYYCLKIWGDVSAGPAGKPNPQGVATAFDPTEFPGEYVTRAQYYDGSGAIGRFDKNARRFVVGRSAGVYSFYCSSLVSSFLGFYYGIDDYRPRYAYFSAETLCTNPTPDWTPTGEPHPPQNPFPERMTFLAQVTPNAKGDDTAQQLEKLITADNSPGAGAPGKRLGHLYVYSLSIPPTAPNKIWGGHTGILAWYRGQVWKLAADGHKHDLKPMTCGPYANNITPTDRRAIAKLFRLLSCDDQTLPLNLFLDGKDNASVEAEQRSALKKAK